MSKSEDDAMKLIEMMAAKSYYNITKSFGWDVMLERQMIDTKSVETCVLVDRIEKMIEVHNQ